MSESQTALVFNLKFASINFPRVRKRSRMEKFGPFPWTENILDVDSTTGILKKKKPFALAFWYSLFMEK